MGYVDITAIACSLIIHTPESMKQRLQGHWISMAEVLHVIKGAYVCLKSEKKVIVYDARGNGGGGITPTITGDHQNRVTDYTAIVLEIHEDISDTRSRWAGCDHAE